MSDYTPNNDYSAKDALTTGDPEKKILGSDIDTEFDEIATAIASKEDEANKGAANGYCGLGAGGLVDPSDLPAATETAIGAVELATTAEVVTGTDTSRAVTAAGVEAWAAQNAGMVQDISNLSDAGADRILFWDFSASAVAQLTLSGLTITTTSLAVDAGTTAAAGVLELATTTEAAAGTDSARAVTPEGLDAWAAQNAGMVFDISNLADPNADQILFWDDSAGAVVGLTVGTNLTLSGTTLSLAEPLTSRPTFTSQGGFLNNASSSNTGGDVTLSATVPTTAGQVGGVGDWRLVYS